MDNIGAEVGQKMRSAIKAKLMELGCYVDDELPDYIMVMVANKRTKSQMNEDLQLFLTTKTSAFVDWLQIVLKKLKEITVTNPEIYKRVSKRKSNDARVTIKVKKEKKEKLKSKKSKKKDIKPIINEIALVKSLTDDLPVQAKKLSEMRKIVVMQENQSVNEDCFDIPPLSEVAISNESELVEIEKKIKNVKSRLGLQVASDSDDEDFIDLKAQPEDLFPNEQPQELKQMKNEITSRKIKLVRRTNSAEESNEIAKEYTGEPLSPKNKSEQHPRIVFGSENVSHKKQSALERLGKKSNMEHVDESVNQMHKKINLITIRKQEEELLGLSKSNREPMPQSNEQEYIKQIVTKSNSSGSPRESALKRLGVMSKVAVPSKEEVESAEEAEEIVHKEVPSAIKVKPRVLPPATNQANKNLLLKAVAEAQRSVAQTPLVGTNSKPDALFTKKFREKTTKGSTSSRKLSDKEKDKIKHILVQADKKEKRDLGFSSDDDNLEYIPRPLKKNRRSRERLEYVPSSKEHSGDDYADNSDMDTNVHPRESKSQTFIITLDGIARQQERNKSSPSKKSLQTEIKNKSNNFEEKKRKSPSPIIFDKSSSTPIPSKLKQIPDKLPLIIPQTSLKTKEKCKYWPGCRQGEKCEFVHPSLPCKTFPQCKFGDKCLYVHPMCKFETSCTRKDCPYSHISRTFSNASAASTKQMCRFYPNCSNAHCMFYHPRPCKYGKFCKNQSECNFSHGFPTRHNFIWHSGVKL